MLRNLEVLRALAALFVVVHHFASAYTGDNETIASFGRFGVDIFFVISGFIMVYTTVDRDTGPKEFLRKRLIRILPLYWGMTIAKFIAGFLVGKSSLSEIGELVKSLAFIPYGTDPLVARPIIFVGWTLNFEMLFYVVFAAFITLRNPAVRSILIGAIFAAFIAVVHLLPVRNFAAIAFASPLIFEFVAGMAIASLNWRHPIHIARIPGIAIVLFCLVAMPSLFWVRDMWLHTATVGALASVIVFTCVALENAGHASKSTALTTLGGASYSLYLTHPYFIQVLMKVLGVVVAKTWMWFTLGLVTALVGASILAVIVFQYVERPILNLLKSGGSQARTKSQTAATLQ